MPLVVADVQPNRPEKALELGADAVIDSSGQDVRARLVELHGEGPDAFGRTGLPGTDIYLDAAAVPAVARTVLAGPEKSAVFGIVAIYHEPVEVDFQILIPSEPTIVHSTGHLTEMLDAARDIIDNADKYALIVNDVVPFSDAARAMDLAGRPGAVRRGRRQLRLTHRRGAPWFLIAVCGPGFNRLERGRAAAHLGEGVDLGPGLPAVVEGGADQRKSSALAGLGGGRAASGSRPPTPARPPTPR